MTMAFCRYTKEEIAVRMLDTAIDLYFSSGDEFSIIHLAAASGEVLAGLIEGELGTGTVTAREMVVSALGEIHRVHGSERSPKEIGTHLNSVRNQTKHHSPQSDPTEISVCLNLEVEQALSQAIENYIQLRGTPTRNIVRYLKRPVTLA